GVETPSVGRFAYHVAECEGLTSAVAERSVARAATRRDLRPGNLLQSSGVDQGCLASTPAIA
ncbi:MAG: hypothetical protein M3O70_17450, partial [Actinomycetota bacterium]|nr:hypothetical protein [Actinomycetota bacterium]